MRIEKGLQQNQPAPQLSDYDQERASFSWEAARAELDVEIPEEDYGKITSFEDAITYVATRL
jgi:hypothetical protein